MNLITIFFVSLILSSQAMLLNPLDKDFPTYLTNINTRVTNIESAKQPYNNDWNELGATTITSNISGIFTFSDTGYDATKVFQVGDKIRFKDGGAFKYAYIIDITTTTLTLNAGVTYSFTNSTITEFAYSRSSNPVGHPLEFTYDAVPAPESGGMGMTGTTSTNNGKYTMNGNQVFVSGYVDGIMNGSAGSQYSITYPFPLKSTSTNRADFIVYGGDSNDSSVFLRTVSRIIVGTVNPSNNKMYVQKPDNSNFVYSPTGSFFSFFNIRYSY